MRSRLKSFNRASTLCDFLNRATESIQIRKTSVSGQVDLVARPSYLASRLISGWRLHRPIISFSFFLPNRPTHFHDREGDGKRNILWGWPKDFWNVESVPFLNADRIL